MNDINVHIANLANDYNFNNHGLVIFFLHLLVKQVTWYLKSKLENKLTSRLMEAYLKYLSCFPVCTATLNT